MADLYNLSGLMSADTIEDLIVVANDASDQLWVGGFVISVFIILVLLFTKSETYFPKAILASSFVCTLLSLFLRQAGMINFIFVIFFSALMAFTFLYLALTKK